MKAKHRYLGGKRIGRWLSYALAACVATQATVPAAWSPARLLETKARHAAPTRATAALNQALELQRRGDYESAAKAIDVAKARQEELTQVERRELAMVEERNQDALRSRQEGSDQLNLLEKLVQAGQRSAAATFLKRILPNEQFLSTPDQERLGKLAEEAHPRTARAALPDNEPATAGNPKGDLQDARKQMYQGHFNEAEEVARRLESGDGSIYGASEDSPSKLRTDIVKYRKDPQFLLAASHQNLKNGDFDRAESLARLADRYAGPATFLFTPDSPSKVLKQIQQQRGKPGTAAAAGEKSNIQLTSATSIKGDGEGNGSKGAGAGNGAGNSKQSPAGNGAGAGKGAGTQNPSSKGAGNGGLGQNFQSPRGNGINGGTGGNGANGGNGAKGGPNATGLKTAKSAGEGASAALLAEVADAKVDSSIAIPAEIKDAKGILAHGRKALSQNKLDEAMECAMRARSIPGSKFGLFDDSPDRLKADVTKARAKAEQQEAGKLLVEARKAYESGDYELASRLAYKAKQLRGASSIFDFGDRPESLLADINKAQLRKGKPGTEVASATVARQNQARALLVDARAALKAGDANRCQQLLEQVESMKVALTAAGDDNTAALRKDLEVFVASRSGSPSGATAKNTKPASKPTKPGVDGASLGGELLAEAAILQKKGNLVEARAKALTAQNTSQPGGDDSANRFLQQLNQQAQATIKAHLEQASEIARADSNPQRFTAAEAEVEKARQLAMAFGLDTQPVVAKRDWLKQARAGAPKDAAGTPVAGVPLPVPFPGTTIALGDKTTGAQPSNQGRTLLDKARQELRAGQAGNARRLAEEAFQGPYGVADDATTVLRSIDIEELNQKALSSRRNFDAMVSAFNRREYSQAKLMMGSVNEKLLDADRQGRLKEIITTPGMLSAVGESIAQTGASLPAGAAPKDTAKSSIPGEAIAAIPPLPGAAGLTAGGDEPSPASDALAQAQALRKVKFDRMQQRGLEVQREAAEKFRTGEMDAALDMLSDYVEQVESEGIDQAKVAQLRRPVESRMQHFKLLKAQKEFLDQDGSAKKDKKNVIGQKMLAEDNRNKKVAEQMKLFNQSFKEGKYLEAESYAMRAQELDPDNAMAAAAINMAKTQRALVAVKGGKGDRENMFLTGLNDAEKVGPALTSDKPIDVGNDRKDLRDKRAPLTALSSPVRKSSAEKEIEGRMNQSVNLNFNNLPLKDVLEDIRAMYQINIVPDMAALEQEGISLDRPVTLKLEQISLKSALNLMLRNVHLTWVVKDEVLQITTESQARGKMSTVTYQVTDLILPVENHGSVSGTNMNPLITRGTGTNGNGNGNNAPGGAPSPIQTPLSLSGGQAVGSPSGAETSQADANWNKRNGQTTEESLIRLITSTIEPQSWSTVGGSGTIEYYPLTMSLVINQTPNIQEQVADLLNNLRRLLDQEVALEVRLISIAEDFYERIGLDFNLNIKTDRNTAKFEPMITSGQYKPAGYINDPYFRNMVGGISPAGAFTSDLDIPINQNSFNLTNPQFGNYLGAPGGGINMGLAFLSDIQVFLFMEAAQGDQRTNVMQAPKLTLFNGQTATINVGDTQFFVMDVGVETLPNGNVTFQPRTQGYFNGIQLTIQAIISADRRTVRLSPNIAMQNLVPGPVNLFPVVVPIFPQPGINQINPADPITFTQLIQQPVIQSISVQTTVAVPDGGTVLMGGLKRLSEARNEYGTPVLSKIPYINRLFRNTGYGRETTSLLMMITPRIVIQEEEEQLQTSFRPTPAVAP